jgi:hypothetical protein
LQQRENEKLNKITQSKTERRKGRSVELLLLNNFLKSFVVIQCVDDNESTFLKAFVFLQPINHATKATHSTFTIQSLTR